MSIRHCVPQWCTLSVYKNQVFWAPRSNDAEPSIEATLRFAPHCLIIFDGKVPGLHVSRIDPKVETQRYIDKIMAAKPPNLDAQEQALMQEDLRRASVEPYAWVLNKSVLGAGTHDPLLAARLAGECKQIERMSAGLAKRLFTLPWLTVPPIGCAELSKLVRSPTSSAASDTNHSSIH